MYAVAPCVLHDNDDADAGDDESSKKKRDCELKMERERENATANVWDRNKSEKLFKCRDVFHTQLNLMKRSQRMNDGPK